MRLEIDRSGGPGHSEFVSHNWHRTHFHVHRGSYQYSHAEHHLTMASLLCSHDILLGCGQTFSWCSGIYGARFRLDDRAGLLPVGSCSMYEQSFTRTLECTKCWGRFTWDDWFFSDRIVSCPPSAALIDDMLELVIWHDFCFSKFWDCKDADMSIW